MAVKPGFQFHDPLLQLGNFIQRLLQGSFQNQDISLSLGRKFFPNLWSNRPCFHKTFTNTLFARVQVKNAIFPKKSFACFHD